MSRNILYPNSLGLVDRSVILRCPGINMRAMLHRCGIRPTRQRVSLASLLFSKGNRHVTAETLLAEARLARVQTSYATIYNVLKRFSEAGLVRCLAVEGHPTIFDTNTTPHHHFFFEDNISIIDLPFDQVSIRDLPKPPEGYEIARVEVMIRLREEGKSKAQHEQKEPPVKIERSGCGGVVL